VGKAVEVVPSGLGSGIGSRGRGAPSGRICEGAGLGPFAASDHCSLLVPASCWNLRRRAFLLTRALTAPPSALLPIGTKDERIIIPSLVSDLNNLYCVGIDPTTAPNRNAGGDVTQDSNYVQGRTVLVKASHMLRLVGVLGPDVLLPMYPGFMPKEPMINKLTKQLEDLILEKSDTVVLDLYQMQPS
jgi:hypothetical protein